MNDDRTRDHRAWPPIHAPLSTSRAAVILVVLYAIAWGGLLSPRPASSGTIGSTYRSRPRRSATQCMAWAPVGGVPARLSGECRSARVPRPVTSALPFGRVVYPRHSSTHPVVDCKRTGLRRRAGPGAALDGRSTGAERGAVRAQLCPLLFAWYLLVRTTPPGRASLFTVGALFAASFTTNSLLPFYLVPMLHLWYLDGYRGGMSAPRYLARYCPLLSLPAGWFLAKLIFFQPYGLYVGYNAISPRRLLQATLLLCLVALPLAGCCWPHEKLTPASAASSPHRSRGVPDRAGGLPIHRGGQGPPVHRVGDKELALLPLGVAFLVLAICRLARLALSRGAAQLMGMAVLASSLVLSASICASYLVDWQKQDALVGAFRRTPALESASTVVFRDETRSMNIFQRRYRFYEWNGLLKRAFGDETRFAVGDKRARFEGSSPAASRSTSCMPHATTSPELGWFW